MMPSANAIPGHRADRLLLASIAGIAFSAALSQFVMIGLLGLCLLPVFFAIFCVGCWRVRRPELSGSTLLGGIVLLSSAAAVVVAAAWGVALTLLTVQASNRHSFAPLSVADWIRPLILWLCASPGIGLGFGLWTEWPRRQVLFWALAATAVLPVAIVALILLSAILPVSA
jgi:hypothetical protein